MQWARQGATPDELAADTRRCEQQAWQEANYYFLGYRPFGPWLYRDAWSGPFLHPAGPFYDPFWGPFPAYDVQEEHRYHRQLQVAITQAADNKRLFDVTVRRWPIRSQAALSQATRIRAATLQGSPPTSTRSA